MKKAKKIIALILTVCMLMVSYSTLAFAGESDTGIDYTIINPYEDVNWLTYKQYRADLHNHTTASDGTDTLKDMLEQQYEYGFDAVAVTDHGVVDYGWTRQSVIPAMEVFIDLFKGRTGDIVPLDSKGGEAANGNTYTIETRKGGSYYSQQTSSGIELHDMLRVPCGIENNPSSLNNAHVNSWFVDYGHGLLGGTSDYETPIKNVHEMGGLSVINHPGEYTNARDEDSTADAYDESDTMYSYYIDKFASLLTKYDSCIGIDVNSKGDSRTRYDRKLWDILLQRVTPTGRNVLAIATSDAHTTNAVFTGYTEMVMPSLTTANFRECLENGSFFACSKNLGNPDEIAEIANYLVESIDPTAVKLGEQLKAMQAEDATAKYEAPKDVEAPTVTAVVVEQNTDTITLVTTGAKNIRWIANGKTIATGN
ncbi:MAG: PHP domain-containing protein, partial [Clostridia bacterium]|nr:PHP domain-containing protein [Clostridia bacterium]